MLTCMRTTLVLDDGLLRQARKRAAERGMTLSDVVNDALRESLRARPSEPRPFRLITSGRGGPRVHHQPEEFKAALDEEDREHMDRLR